MPQALALGNGNLQINLGANLLIQDLYYPYVGQENHTGFQKPHKIGVWIDGQFSWLMAADWHFDIRYQTGTLVGDSVATNETLQVKLHFSDFIYTTHDVLVRRITIENLADHEREVRIFLGHDFYLYGDKIQDTAQYDPDFNGVVHYRRQRYFLVNGRWDDNGVGLDQFSVGKSNYQNQVGTWKDAEDGHLHGNAIEQGSVDSVIGFFRKIPPKNSVKLNIWVVAGKTYEEITEINNRVLDFGVEKIYQHTKDYWFEWSQKHDLVLNGVSAEIRDLWRTSLLVMRTQIDNRGAIIASTDSDIMKFNKDSYAYMWPRDGALVSLALSRIGYWGPVQKFLYFCRNILTKDGYALNKYTPEASLGSCWHPSFRHGEKQLPIQEDESALILVAMWEFYQNSKMTEVVQDLFNSVVIKIGDFLTDFVDPKTNLPRPSYDLWEERYGVFTYTSSTVYAGLVAAANLSRITGHYVAEKKFAAAAKKIQKAIVAELFCKKRNRFIKGILCKQNDLCEIDDTIDASVAFVWEMGVLPANDPRVVATMKAIEAELTLPNGGIARYKGDVYQKDYKFDQIIPGNAWIITTLWLANWYIETAVTRRELKKAKDLIEWSAAQANAAGVLPEQVHPFTGEPLSVAPLTWSHSTFVDTVFRYSQAYERLK